MQLNADKATAFLRLWSRDLMHAVPPFSNGLYWVSKAVSRWLLRNRHRECHDGRYNQSGLGFCPKRHGACSAIL